MGLGANLAHTTLRIVAAVGPRSRVPVHSAEHGPAPHVRGDAAAGEPRHQLGSSAGGRGRPRHPTHRHPGTLQDLYPSTTILITVVGGLLNFHILRPSLRRIN